MRDDFAPAFNPPVAAPGPMGFDCVLRAWHAHDTELRRFLTRQLHDPALAEDVLQEVFLKSMRLGYGFCTLDNPRAWLYRVARNAVADHHRSAKPCEALPLDLMAPTSERAAVDELDACLAHNMALLAAPDRAVIQACDIDGQTVAAYASHQSLSLPAAKSRLLRARQRLRQLLIQNCQVRFDATGQVCCHTACTSG